MTLSVDDVVYHAKYGKGKVIQVLKGYAFPYLVLFDSGFQEQFKLGELKSACCG